MTALILEQDAIHELSPRLLTLFHAAGTADTLAINNSPQTRKARERALAEVRDLRQAVDGVGLAIREMIEAEEENEASHNPHATQAESES